MRYVLTLAAIVAAIAAPVAAAADPSGEPIETSSYTGPFYDCSIGATAAFPPRHKPHQGRWHAAQLVKQGWTCSLVLPATFAAEPSSSMACRIMDAREQPVAVPDAELLSVEPRTRSLANGWTSASYIGGAFVCVPVADPTSWTDDSLSVYDRPNTPYASPIGASS